MGSLAIIFLACAAAGLWLGYLLARQEKQKQRRREYWNRQQ